MKKNFHPTQYEVTVECACGNRIHTASTASSMRVDICSKCHPYFSGVSKFVDRAGRIERFKDRYGNAATRKS